MLPIPTAAPLGEPHLHPVAGRVSTPMETAPIHERFHQLNPMPILGLPIFHQAATHPAPTPAGQSTNTHPPGNEKAGVVGQSIESGCSLSIVPSYPPIPWLTPPGGCPEKPGGHRTILLGAQQILEVLPHRAAVAQIMLRGQQRFEDRAPDRIPADFVEDEAGPTGSALLPPDWESTVTHSNRRCFIRLGLARRQGGSWIRARSWSLLRKLRAAMSANCPLGRTQFQSDAQLARQPVPAPRRVLLHPLPDLFQLTGLPRAPLKFDRFAHLGTREAQIGFRVQRKIYFFSASRRYHFRS